MSNIPEKENNEKPDLLRALVEDYYDIQGMRIEASNQLDAYRRSSDEIDQEWVDAFRETVLDRLILIEKGVEQYVNNRIKDEELYVEWLKDIKGLGPILSAGLICWIGDIERFDTISKLWAYIGLHVDKDGRAVRRRAGQKSNWHSRLKSHCWKIGESFVKQKADKSGYRALYDKFRKEYDGKWKTPEDCGSVGCKNKGKGKCMKGHRFAAAKRKTVKVFLAHYWQRARELKGLKVKDPFIIGRTDSKGVQHTHKISVIEQ